MTRTNGQRRCAGKRLLLAAAATVGTLAVLSAAQPVPVEHVGVVADGDDNFVNDNGQTSGDIFQQNAQSQNNG